MAKKSIPAPQADTTTEPQWLSLGDPEGLNFWEREWTETTQLPAGIGMRMAGIEKAVMGAIAVSELLALDQIHEADARDNEGIAYTALNDRQRGGLRSAQAVLLDGVINSLEHVRDFFAESKGAQS